MVVQTKSLRLPSSTKRDNFKQGELNLFKSDYYLEAKVHIKTCPNDASATLESGQDLQASVKFHSSATAHDLERNTFSFKGNHVACILSSLRSPTWRT
eukprot:1633004-Amphidinium_carterae.1